ncbi:hypothetical protein [Flaviaesturariibacter aridisoli]|uniref:Lipoprotein n=1 Tax=Flaviaesturariibacter aridisoli TaxID=2545761 RepID=A0A4R4E562_9BACT|nr:hypothetical protein [Flaviaesturariibacter aridisoli]TCZ73161.1 hypothetical protein E0486_07355 [Flaviaesturariibacter aridisoli]
MNSLSKVSALLLAAATCAGCAGYRAGEANKNEQVAVKITEKPDVINYAVLQRQDVPSLAARGGSRGVVSGLAGGAISLATTAIKQMIAKDKAKYNAEYSQALTDLYFYDQLSTQGPFDPIGMQFNGFRMVRTFQNGDRLDTALVADFELDTRNPYEIINNSIFRLKLRSLKLNYAKAKVANNGKRTLNMDFEITFNSSYVNGDGVLFKNMELGRFYFFLRDAPLDPSAPNYAEYYNGLQGKPLEGKSFIVPRSYGYHVVGSNATEPSFSQGAYDIHINVKESSKNSFVNTMIIDNSGNVIDLVGDKVKAKIN